MLRNIWVRSGNFHVSSETLKWICLHFPQYVGRFLGPRKHTSAPHTAKEGLNKESYMFTLISYYICYILTYKSFVMCKQK